MGTELLPKSLLELCNRTGERENLKKERLISFVRVSPENQTSIAKAWNSLTKKVRFDIRDSLATLFLVFPIEITDQPFPALFGKRTAKPDAETDSYDEIAKHAKALLKLLTKEKYHNLSWDVPSNQRVQPLNVGRLRAMLEQVQKEAESANPYGKYLTKKPLAEGAGRTTLVIQIADLNRYLKEASHAALATLGNVLVFPCPNLNAREIQEAWRRLKEQNGNEPEE